MAEQDTLREIEVIEKINDFSGGLNTKIFATELQPNESQQLKNLEVEDPGRLRKREGTTSFGATLNAAKILGGVDFDPDNGGDQRTIWATANQIHSIDSAAATSLLGTLPTSGQRTHMLQALNKIYISNGTDEVRVLSSSYSISALASGATLIPRHTTAVNIKNRILCNDVGNPTYVHYSGALDDIFSRGTDNFKFSEGEGGRIVKLQAFRSDECLVFLDNRIEELILAGGISGGTPGSDWSRKVIDTRFGCAAANTVQEVLGTVFFLDSNLRVRAMNRTALDAVQGTQAIPVSDKIQPDLDRINKAQITKCVAGAFRDWYLLSVPLDSATEPDNVYAFNVVRGSWSGPWTIKASVFIVSDVEGQGKRLYVGRSDVGRALQMFNGTKTDDGSAYEVQFTTKKHNFGHSEQPKIFQELETVLLATSGGSVTVEGSVDAGGYTELEGSPFTVATNAPSLPITLPYNLAATGLVHTKHHVQGLGRGRDIEFRLTHNSTDDFHVISYHASALIENYEKENQS